MDIRKFTEANLMEAHAAGIANCGWLYDLLFIIDGERVWLKNAHPDRDISEEEDAWNDELIAQALENGAEIVRDGEDEE